MKIKSLNIRIKMKKTVSIETENIIEWEEY